MPKGDFLQVFYLVFILYNYYCLFSEPLEAYSTETLLISLNISEVKGTIKHQVPSVTINQKGIVGDAHAGDWHRQVSLLGVESFQKMTEGKDVTLDYGVFAENITTEGFSSFLRVLSSLYS